MQQALIAWRRLDDAVAAGEKLLLVMAVAVMVGMIFAQSVLRFFFEYNLFGASSWATVLLVWVGFISASIATRDRKHIVVDIVPKLLGDRRVVYVINTLVYLATAAFLAYAAWAAWTYYQSPGVQFRSIIGVQLPWQDTPLPTKYVVVIMPIAVALTSLRFFQIGIEEAAIYFGRFPAELRRMPPTIDDLITEIRAGQPENGEPTS